MTKETNEKKSIQFTDSDRLKLQQLKIRREIAVEPPQKLEKEEKNKSTTDELLGEDEHWQLISPDIQLHDWQKKCLDIWVPKGRGTVKVATGGGKTIFALAAAQQLQNKVDSKLKLAIVVPTIPLMYQWYEDLIQSNLHESQIGLLGDGNKITESPELRIIVAVLDGAREKLPGIINSLNWSANLLLVVDECHRSNAKEARKIFNTNPKYTLGLSATPEVNVIEEEQETMDEDSASADSILKLPTDDEYSHSAVGKALGGIIFDFTLKECLEAGLLTKFDIFHVGLSLNNSEAAKYRNISKEISELHRELQARHRNSNSRQNFIAWCESIASREEGGNAAKFIGLTGERKRLLYGASDRKAFTILLLKAATTETLKNNSKTIVFHEKIDEINSIYDEAEKIGLPVVLEHSKLNKKIRTESIELFRKGITKVIISARSLVVGFNVPSADIGIIAASSSSVRQRIQSLGRMLRKSDSAENAKIFILYIKDTEDESIYEKADWVSVLGAERSRYFQLSDSVSSLTPSKNINEVIEQLPEKPKAPREFRPSCREVDTSQFSMGDSYPAQTVGTKVKLDNARNFRTEDDKLVKIDKKTANMIIQKNDYRSAVITPCGHLICRDSEKKDAKDSWIYLCLVELPTDSELNAKEKFKIKQIGGKISIVKVVGRDESYARGIEKANCKKAGQTHDDLLVWIKSKETELKTEVKLLNWDGKTNYWIEVEGEQILYDKAQSKLEFPEI